MAQRFLLPEHKKFIVEQLAIRKTPSEVVQALEENFGIHVSRQNIIHYNPTKLAGRTLCEELRTLFHTRREEYETEYRRQYLKRLDEKFARQTSRERRKA